MTRRVLIDTGPIVAVLSPQDQHHGICSEILRSFREPLLTCWPVLTEAAWLARKRFDGLERLLDGVNSGLWHPVGLDADAAVWIKRFVAGYRSIGAQLADAALMYLAEREGIDTVFTLDRRDFSVYQTSRGEALRLLPE